MDYNNVYDINKDHKSVRDQLRREALLRKDPLWSNFYWDLDIRQDYLVSNQGLIWDTVRDCAVSASPNQYGDIRVNLSLNNGVGYKTISVRHAVANAFVEQVSTYHSALILKDLDQTNLCADNLAWRPPGFSRHYRQQFQDIPKWFLHGPVTELHDDWPEDVEYDNVLEAARANGILVKSVYDSCELDGEPCMYIDIGFQWT